jgi:hypothetical protein
VLGAAYAQTLCDDLGAEHVPKEYGGTCVCYPDKDNTCLLKKIKVDLKGILQRHGKLGLADGLSEAEAALIPPFASIAEARNWQQFTVKSGTTHVVEIPVASQTDTKVPDDEKTAADAAGAAGAAATGSGALSPPPIAAEVPQQAVWFYVQPLSKNVDLVVDFQLNPTAVAAAAGVAGSPSDATSAAVDSEALEPEIVMEKTRVHAPGSKGLGDAAPFARGVYIVPDGSGAGTLRLHLDNTYSKMTAKKVRVLYGFTKTGGASDSVSPAAASGAK